LKDARSRAIEEVSELKPLKILSEIEYHNLSLKYAEVFEAGTGAEALRKLFSEMDMKKFTDNLRKQLEKKSGSKKVGISIVHKKILRRLRMMEKMMKQGIKPEWMFLTVLPVIPPDLRPMVQLDGGRYASSDLNDLYRRVINRNNRLKYLLEISAPEVIVRNEKRMLQEAVDALIDNGMRKGQTTTATTGGKRLLKSLADMLKGKQGRFRQNLLGKRVDYSGRSVIVVGPELKLFQCGLPKTMALELFKPFVIRKIIEQELAYNVRAATRLIDEETAEVWAILEDVVKDRYVLLNRAPTLHRLGVQAFKPLLVEGEAISLHPLVCTAFNADFDGDQMAVHVPLSEKAQKEAREIMATNLNLLKPANGMPIVTPTKDIVLGCYFLTQIISDAKTQGKIFYSTDEAKMACDLEYVDLRAKIKVVIEGKKALVETSVGRIIFNEALPDDHEFVNEEINSRKLEKIIADIIGNKKSNEAVECLDKVKSLGFEYSTISGVSWGMDDLIVPKEKPKIIGDAENEVEKIYKFYKQGLLSQEEKISKVVEIWQRAKMEIEKLVPETLPHDGSVFMIINSGARGSWAQPVQMSGMKGLVINPAGQIIEMPAKHSYKEGLDVLEYFITTHGARKGTADTALRTSTAGYLTRRLVDVTHEVVIHEEDCGDEQGIVVSAKAADDLGQDLIFKIFGRISLENIRTKKGSIIVKKGETIDLEKANEIKKSEIKEIKIRSPLTCKNSDGICRKCYGLDLGDNKLVKTGEAVGVVAAQAIGEPGTQLTMRTFHTGGVAGVGDITLGLPRVTEIFECRMPAGKAVISSVDGKVMDVGADGTIKIKAKIEKIDDKKNPLVDEKTEKTKKTKKVKKDGDIVEYQIQGKKAIWVEKDDEIKKGQQLCEGSIDLHELFKAAGSRLTYLYILKEIQKIYTSQGVSIHDKHVEIVVRQMFSRVKIKDFGDTSFNQGEIVEKTRVIEENKNLKKTEKPAVYEQVLLGISKVALSTDSFLSSASFQETSRILIHAALEGKEDHLRGLKENVMIGKLIPAGTGFRK
jgi:DNA-directed RNA polymerase subunit beta'